ELYKGYSDETSCSENITANNWENELAILFILINDGDKDVSSRDGMKRTVETSSFYQGWLDNVEKDFSLVHDAIKTKDVPRFGE
ncbi:diphosphomevalonate decarboxylase, partial [Enterococcus faecalis]|nr:diphosphomevalonate decarboxylase [Enterococcus faecalis]